MVIPWRLIGHILLPLFSLGMLNINKQGQLDFTRISLNETPLKHLRTDKKGMPAGTLVETTLEEALEFAEIPLLAARKKRSILYNSKASVQEQKELIKLAASMKKFRFAVMNVYESQMQTQDIIKYLNVASVDLESRLFKFLKQVAYKDKVRGKRSAERPVEENDLMTMVNVIKAYMLISAGSMQMINYASADPEISERLSQVIRDFHTHIFKSLGIQVRAKRTASAEPWAIRGQTIFSKRSTEHNVNLIKQTYFGSVAVSMI